MSTDLSVRARQLYRALLRELPRRHLALSSTAPLKRQFRERFIASAITSPSPSSSSSPLSSSPSSSLLLHHQIERAEQFVQYAKAQRMYATLLARYNPGMDMDQEERVRLTARRVGMDLPVENNNNYDGDNNVEGQRQKEVVRGGQGSGFDGEKN